MHLMCFSYFFFLDIGPIGKSRNTEIAQSKPKPERRYLNSDRIAKFTATMTHSKIPNLSFRNT
jgi:hypothetical protein